MRPDIAYINNTVALEKMKTGEIAGIASTGGKPNDLFVKLKPEPGFHFFPSTTPKTRRLLHPCPLSHDDCPQLIPEGQTTEPCARRPCSRSTTFPRVLIGQGASAEFGHFNCNGGSSMRWELGLPTAVILIYVPAKATGVVKATPSPR